MVTTKFKTQNPLDALYDSYVYTSKDMGEDKFDAWNYGIIVGWDKSSYTELKIKYNWSDEDIADNRRLHLLFNETRNKL